MARHILTETTTDGLRVRRCGKYFLTPGAGQVQTQWGPVRLKLAQGYGVTHAKPEFEDAAQLAREHGVPYQAVLQEALGQLNGLESKWGGLYFPWERNESSPCSCPPLC